MDITLEIIIIIQFIPFNSLIDLDHHLELLQDNADNNIYST
jgi:hypothetical protein